MTIASERKHLVITGASGLLGSKIVQLAQGDFEITPLHHEAATQHNSIQVDITAAKKLDRILVSLMPDVVIHTASETNVDRCEIEKDHAWKVNVEGTRNVAEACRKTGAKLVYISTDYVFDGEKGDYREEEEASPINYYGVTKLEGENAVKQLCSDFLILRTSVLYGWHKWKQNFVTWILGSLKSGKKIVVVDDHVNTPTLADNLGEATLEAIQQDLKGLYHASGSQRINRYEFALLTAKAFDLDTNLISPIRMRELTAWKAKRPKDSSLNTNRLQRLLKTKLVDIDEGLGIMRKSQT